MRCYFCGVTGAEVRCLSCREDIHVACYEEHLGQHMDPDPDPDSEVDDDDAA